MTDTREASWYEIALTHSQIVKIFVVLLLCLVGAFFSGVWIGRDAAASIEELPQPAAAAQLVDEGEGQEVAQLKFFSDGDVVATGNGNGGKAPRAEPRPDSTPVEDVAAEPRARIVENEGVVEAPPATRGAPDEPVPVTRESTGSSADAVGELVVQVFSSNDATQARRVLGRLAQGGHPAYLSPVEVDGRTMYRVRIGPYADRSRAESVADTVRRTFKLDTWITQKST